MKCFSPRRYTWIIFLLLVFFPLLIYPDPLYLPLILKNYDVGRTPVAVDDAYQTNEDFTLPGSPSVLANDRDPRGLALTAVLVNNVSHGSLTFHSDGSFTYAPEANFNGTDSFTYKAGNGTFFSSPATVRITVNPVNDLPVAVPGDGRTVTQWESIVLNGSGSFDREGTALGFSWTLAGKPAGSQAVLHNADTANPSFIPDVPGTYTIQLIVNDGTGYSAPAEIIILVEAAAPGLTVPPLDPTQPTSLFKATEFLYTGSDSIQTGVALGAIEVKRAAVIRGQVLDREGHALPGAIVSILNHPEYGQTLSRANGMYDLAVNGGGPLTVRYEKSGFLKAQRQADVPWQDYVWIPEVVLIPYDTLATNVNLSSPSFQVAGGSVQTDADGSRQATLLVPPGTAAQMVLPGGGTQPLSSLTIRASEYTVGPNGPSAMPAPLPPNIGYTYCVELTADEAEQAGATTVQFNQPLPIYVDNFLGFPVGILVPAGYYDRQKAAWVPAPNGRVIRIVGVTGGLADLDVDANPGADPALYASLGITDPERAQLALLYPVNQELWRVPVTHFTPWDLNWAAMLPSDATAPDQRPPDWNKPKCDPCKQTGSILECQNQTLGQEMPIIGTPYSLSYRSNRSPGRTEAYTIEIPLSGPTVPASLTGILLEIRVAGRFYRVSRTNAPSQTYTFTWDGKDAYGRYVQGRQPIKVRTGYVYGATYGQPSAVLNSSFGSFSSIELADTGARQPITVWQEWEGLIGAWISQFEGLGGFNLDVHHAYDRRGGVLIKGDGGEVTAEAIASQVANRIAGRIATGTGNGDGGPALLANLNTVYDLAGGPDGSLFVVHSNGSYTTIRKIAPDGIISTLPEIPVYGAGEYLALGPDGSLYFFSYDRIYRYDPAKPTGEKLSPVVIVGAPFSAGCEECPADGSAGAVGLRNPRGLAVGPDGTLYIADTGNHRVRKVDSRGSITTIAGTYNQAGSTGDGNPAGQARLNSPYDVALGPDGALYIADSGNARIRRIGVDGIITTFAGSGTACANGWTLCGDGGPAVSAQLYFPGRIAVGNEGSLFISEYQARVRRVSPDGMINAFLGDPAAVPLKYVVTGGEGRPPASIRFLAQGTTMGPDGNFFVGGYDESNPWSGMILKISAPFKGLELGDLIVPSADGSELYIFDAAQRHERTLNAYTNAVMHRFEYDAAGLLIKIYDAYENMTLIERDASGWPAAVVGPFGQRTELALDANGYLASLSNPAGNTTSFSFGSLGLMTGLTDPNGNSHTFTYGADGRLTQDRDPANNLQTLARTQSDSGYGVTHTTAEGRPTTYAVERLDNGSERQVNTFPSGAVTSTSLFTNASTGTAFQDGSSSVLTKAPDPRFGMRSPLTTTSSKMPSNLELTEENRRNVILSNPADILSVQSITEETIYSGSRTYRLDYAAATRKFSHRSPEGRQRELTVNDKGAVTRIDTPGALSLAPITMTYYPANGLLQETASGDLRQTFVRDSRGRLQSVANAAAETTQFIYDDADRVTGIGTPLGNNFGFAYDPNGNLTELQLPSGALHGLGYNTLNRLSGYTPPGSIQSYAWTYNRDRQLTRITLPTGRPIDVSYDTAGRKTQVHYGEANVELRYNDLTDRIFQIERIPATGPSQQIAYGYDGFLLTGLVFSGVASGAFSYTYDANFFLTGIGFSDGGETFSLPLARDNDGLVVGYGDFALDRDDALGRPLAVRDNGSGVHTLQIDYTYDTLGRLTGRTHTVNGTEIFKLQLSRDNTGRIIQKRDGATFDYVYDADGRLTEVYRNGAGWPQEQYAYDANSNRTGTIAATASYDVQDRILEQGGVIYQHDVDGFMTQRGSDTLVYSARGELLEAAIGGNTVAYAYDGFGRRVGRHDGSGNWYQYIYGDPHNGNLITAARDASGVLTSYLYDDFGHLFAFRRDGAWFYVATDQVGSPRVVSDASGTPVKTIEYDSFGSRTDNNPGFDLPFGFAGGIHDPDTGLVRFGFRDYEPVIGRWTAKDPILFGSGQINLYTYVQNNPVLFVDPDGTKSRLDPVLDVVDEVMGLADFMWHSFFDTHVHPPAIEGKAPERWYYETVSCKQEVKFGPKYYEGKNRRNSFIREPWYWKWQPGRDAPGLKPTGPEA